MTWLAVALGGPFLYALTNYIDKLLLQRYFREQGAGTILIGSALLSAMALPFLALAAPELVPHNNWHLAALVGVGVLNVLVLYFYLKALEAEAVAVAIIFYQLVPVFAVALGYLVLGESLSGRQLVATAVVIAGTSLVSLERGAEGFHLRTRTMLFMTAASFCWALGAVIFKAVALKEEVLCSLFWEHVALTAIGLGLFVGVPSLRRHLRAALATNSAAILSLGVLNELFYIAGNIVMAFAYLMAPVALVLLANSYQAVFALAFAALLALVRPDLVQTRESRSSLAMKAAAIAITALGTYLLGASAV